MARHPLDRMIRFAIFLDRPIFPSVTYSESRFATELQNHFFIGHDCIWFN